MDTNFSVSRPIRAQDDLVIAPLQRDGVRSVVYVQDAVLAAEVMKIQRLHAETSSNLLQVIAEGDDAAVRIVSDLQSTVKGQQTEHTEQMRTMMETVEELRGICLSLQEEMGVLRKDHTMEKDALKSRVSVLELDNETLRSEITQLKTLSSHIDPVEKGLKEVKKNYETERSLRWVLETKVDKEIKELSESLVPLREIARGANDTAVQALTLSLANEKTSLGLEMKLVTLSTNMAEKEEEIKRLNASLQENERRLQIAQQTATEASSSAASTAAAYRESQRWVGMVDRSRP